MGESVGVGEVSAFSDSVSDLPARGEKEIRAGRHAIKSLFSESLFFFGGEESGGIVVESGYGEGDNESPLSQDELTTATCVNGRLRGPEQRPSQSTF